MHNENPPLLSGPAVDRAIVKWQGEAVSSFVLVAGRLLSLMRAGEIKRGGELPASAPYAKKTGVSENAVTNAKLMLLALGLVEKDGYHNYASLVEPQPARPGPEQVAAWQRSDDLTERIMGDLAERITGGRIAHGAELDPRALQQEWECGNADTPAEALRRLAAFPGLVTVKGARYFVT